MWLGESSPNAYGSHSCYRVSLPACTYGLMWRSLWSSPMINQQRRGRLQPGLHLGLHDTQDHSKVDICSTIAPDWNIPEGQWWREVPPGRTSEQCTWLFTLFGRRNDQKCDFVLHWFMGCGQQFGWMARDLEGRGLESWGQGNLENRHVDRHLRLGKKHEDTCVSHECSPKGDVSRGIIK